MVKKDCIMRKAFAISFLAILALAGCQVNEIVENVPVSMSFTATIEDNFDGVETRTSLDENGNVRWKQGDQISIFVGSTINEQYQVTDDSDGKTSASIIKVTGSGFVGGGEIDNNIAFYPYASTAEIAKNGSAYVISNIDLPATQYYAEGSFGNGAFPMAAVTSNIDDMHLKFKNVLGGLKLQLKGTATISSISVTGNSNEILCGAAEVTASSTSTPSINLTDASAKTVTLNCGEGVQLNAETATSFIIALPPMTMESGFIVVVTDTEGQRMRITTSKTQTINRSTLLKMPEVVYEGVSEIRNPLTFTSTGKTSISLVKVESPDNVSLEYRLDGGGWMAYTVGDAIDLTDGEKVSFRAGANGNTTFGKSEGYYHHYHSFVITGRGTVAASGNIMSLLNQKESFAIPSPYCFYGLFDECTNLTTAPELPATTLASYCYRGMFSGCSSLTTAPELPATTLASNCYSYMFYGCTRLTTAPELPATTLASNCYYNMFSGCTSLITAPTVLPATTLAERCCLDMFHGCTRLTTAPELPATTLASYCYYNMFSGCTSLITAPTVLPATTLAEGCYEGMFSDCTSLTTAPELSATILGPQCCKSMFSDCTSLTTAPELPAPYLAESCYYQMFYGCTSLTTAPELPATTLASYCYQRMFWGCSSLTTAPELPATTLAGWCYEAMFCHCSSLTTAPTVLPASKLYYYSCSSMFADCTKLTTAPELPATTLASYCYYNMFSGCTSLITAPTVLPATTLAERCYEVMFSDCTSLTAAPELPATALAEFCYDSMFRGCTSLTTAPELPATTLASYCYSSMFRGCTSLTTAPELPAPYLKQSCYDGMFYGCTSLTTAPELPATTLASYCYRGMFRGCSSLTTAPELPAPYLAESCYRELFYGCSNLNYIKALFTTTPSSTYTTSWIYGVATTGTFVKSGSATWDVTGLDGVPPGWTVTTE